MKKYFKFKGNSYYEGTIVKIYDDKQKEIEFNRYLKFYKFDHEQNKYKFHSIWSCWESYAFSIEELESYIESIETACTHDMLEKKSKVEPKYIDGIATAWTWYILIMLGALFIKGIIGKILTQIIATWIFTTWRAKKMRGE